MKINLKLDFDIELEKSLEKSINEQVQKKVKELFSDKEEIMKLIKPRLEKEFEDYFMYYDIFESEGIIKYVDELIKSFIDIYINENRGEIKKKIGENIMNNLNEVVKELMLSAYN